MFQDFFIVIIFVIFIIALFRKDRSISKQLYYSKSVYLWAFLSICYFIIRGISYLFLNELLHRFTSIFNELIAFVMIYWIETLITDRPRILVYGPFLFLGGITVGFSLAPANIRVIMLGGLPTFQWAGTWEMMGLIMNWVRMAYIIIFFLFLAAKSPRYLKMKVMAISLVGIISGFTSDFIESAINAHIDTWSPGVLIFLYILSGVMVSFNYFFWCIIILKYPEIVTILPFKALRLVIIETESGIPIFNHDWESRNVLAQEDLFSGMLQGISMILTESVNRGNVNEVILDDAVLIMERSKEYPVACVLVSTKSSRYLKQALKSFSTRFFIEFKDSFSMPHDTSKFDPAENLVNEFFNFLPRTQKMKE